MSPDSISEFIKEIGFSEMNAKLWESVCKRLILPVESRNKNDRIRSIKQIKQIQFPYQNDGKFNGIMKHLSEITNGNIQTNKTIEIKCSKQCCGSIESIVDYTKSEGAFHVNGDPTPRWLQFDFKSRKIQINSYLIKTSNNDNTHIYNWKVEISTDGKNWEEIDERNEVKEFNGKNQVKSFEIEMTKPFNFIRFITNKRNFYNEDGFALGKIEFYGNIISE